MHPKTHDCEVETEQSQVLSGQLVHSVIEPQIPEEILYQDIVTMLGAKEDTRCPSLASTFMHPDTRAHTNTYAPKKNTVPLTGLTSTSIHQNNIYYRNLLLYVVPIGIIAHQELPLKTIGPLTLRKTFLQASIIFYSWKENNNLFSL